MARSTKGKTADTLPPGPAKGRAARKGAKVAGPRKSAAAIPKAPRPKKKPPAPNAAPPKFRRGRFWSDDLALTIWDYVENFGQKPYEDAVPTITALAAHIGCSVDTMHEWRKPPKDEDGAPLPHKSEARASFADGMDVLMSVQGRVLINGGILGHFSGVVTKLMLGNHGYAERKEVSGVDGKPVAVTTTQIITTETSAEEAARIYTSMLGVPR